MPEHKVLLEGEFSPKVKTYWLLSPTVAMGLSIVLIPVVPIYLLIARLIVDRWLAAMRCTLTERTLIIRKGLLNRVESTVPLEKITDLQLFQGPVMRYLGLKGFRVETAGQSAGAGGYLVNIIGLKDTDGFREAVLAQSERVSDHARGPGQAATPSPGEPDAELLAVAQEIRDTLARIESRLPQSPG